MRYRRTPPVKSKPKYAVVVEGGCEFWYVQMLKRNERDISFDLKPEIPQKKKLSEQYKLVIQLADIYDKVFWIIDCDVIANETRLAPKGTETAQQQLEKYIKIIERDYNERVVIIRNNPCLEYWLLLHFEETTTQFNDCDDVGKRLKRQFSTYKKTQTFYTKPNNDIYLQIKPRLASAIKSAAKISKLATGNPNASISQMHILFQALDL